MQKIIKLVNSAKTANGFSSKRRIEVVRIKSREKPKPSHKYKRFACIAFNPANKTNDSKSDITMLLNVVYGVKSGMTTKNTNWVNSSK